MSSDRWTPPGPGETCPCCGNTDGRHPRFCLAEFGIKRARATVTALPVKRRDELNRRFEEATEAAQRHATYNRPG